MRILFDGVDKKEFSNINIPLYILVKIKGKKSTNPLDLLLTF